MSRPFRLTVHLHKPSGQYRKRIGGHDYYLGTDHDAAVVMLQKMVDKKNATRGGVLDGSIRIDALVSLYISNMEGRVAAKTMQRATAKENERSVVEFQAIVGDAIEVRELLPEHFAKVRKAWADRISVHALNRYILSVKGMFNWAKDSAVILNVPSYGNSFDQVSRALVRQHKTKMKMERGDRHFTDDELRAIINHSQCTGVLRTCIMLALNCGFYAVDCGELRWRDVGTIKGVPAIVRERFKTSIAQYAPLWPALAERIEMMRPPKPKLDDLVFRQPNGSPIFQRDSDHDWLGRQFTNLYRDACTPRPGLGFGSLKHTHASALGDVADRVAKFAVRAHLLPDETVEGAYDVPSIQRLVAVTDLAYERLWKRHLSPLAQTPEKA